MAVSLISSDKGEQLLTPIGLLTDSWGRLVRPGKETDFYEQVMAPKDSLELYCFSLNILAWLGFSNDWVIIKFDGSNSMSLDERVILSSLSDFKLKESLVNGNPFLLADGTSNKEEYIQISSIVFHCLMFKSHCWITASAIENSRRLSIQDGCVYFLSIVESDLTAAKTIIEQSITEPLKLPEWLIDEK